MGKVCDAIVLHTRLLRDSLGTRFPLPPQTVMIANIWGEPCHQEETLSTLRFASRVRLIVTDVMQVREG